MISTPDRVYSSELTLGQHWSYAIDGGASSGLDKMRTVIVAH